MPRNNAHNARRFVFPSDEILTRLENARGMLDVLEIALLNESVTPGHDSTAFALNAINENLERSAYLFDCIRQNIKGEPTNYHLMEDELKAERRLAVSNQPPPAKDRWEGLSPEAKEQWANLEAKLRGQPHPHPSE